MNLTWLSIAAVVGLLLSVVNGYRKGIVRIALNFAITIASIVIVWFLNPYVNDFLRDNTPVYETIQNGCRDLTDSLDGMKSDPSRVEQNELIDSLDFPKALTDMLKDNNKASVYSQLGVYEFRDYLVDSLSNIILNAVSFLVTFLLVTIVLRTLAYLLNMVVSLPGLRAVNRMAGAAFGIVYFLVILWVVMLLITAVCNTAVGERMMELIRKDAVMNFLYDHNILAELFAGVFYNL